MERPIQTEDEYRKALARIKEIFQAAPGTPEGDELDALSESVERYEKGEFSFSLPPVVEFIKCRLSDQGLTTRDLIPLIGSRSKVSEVMSGKRPLTLPMMKALRKHLGIPAEVFFEDENRPGEKINLDSFPVNELVKRGWISPASSDKKAKEGALEAYLLASGNTQVQSAAFFRRRIGSRENAKTDVYALAAWCLKVREIAGNPPLPNGAAQKGLTPEFLRDVAKLSIHGDGPIRARRALLENGIRLVVLRHLPKTYLDGAAMRLSDGNPVIALTLRYDRIDHFWFCLLHELAHVMLHLGEPGAEMFVDDMSLRTNDGGLSDDPETQADKAAQEALIPSESWKKFRVAHPTANRVMAFASEAGVHPAIIAGRVRHENRDFRLLSQFVGQGEVHPLFAEELKV